MADSAGTDIGFPDLPCTKIVHRALIWENWVDRQTGYILPAAFIRRAHEKGLSVGIDVSVHEYLQSRFRKPTYGVGSLHVGRVRDLGLQVIQDKVDHGEVRGLPLREENAAEAERLASKLAKQARWVNET